MLDQLVLVTRARSNSVSSSSVRLSVWRMQPSTCARTPSGLMICPQSCAHHTFSTAMAPVRRSTTSSTPIAT
jgi:hypothetical protein